MEVPMGAASVVSVVGLLGGPSVVKQKARTSQDWISIVRRGLPAMAIEALARAVQLTQAELGAILAIPERTLLRRKKEGILNTEESAKLVRVARVMHRAIEVFEDQAAALDWLKHPNQVLGHASPLSLLDTDLGAESVLDTLGRIEHGVFA
jgi:putative toxin-antitoxin system antitoxin component (TIGR02293 family)